ncbi:MAG: efflux RND transporter permease subunit [Gammaproteobacteria bacterium]
MMQWVVESSLRLRLLVIAIAAGMMFFGITQLRNMPVDVYPEFDPPLVEVQTEALGLSAPEMESLITVPMEADLLNGVAWLDQIYSETVSGLSSILLIFDPGTDPIRARQMVQERLTQAHALPNVSQPPVMLQPLSATSRAMMVGLSAKELPLIDMAVLARWNIKPRLMGVPGVANVAIWGQRERQLHVQVDPQQLHAKGVTLDQVIKTTGESLWVSPLSYLQSSKPGTAGWIDTPNQRISIRHLLPISSPEDLAKVTVVGTAPPLRLGDVAKVVEDHQPLIGDALLNDGPGLLLVIEKFPGANTLEVTRGVEEALDAMRPGLAGIEIDTTVFRPANYIEMAIGNLSSVVLIGIVLMFVVLGAFFFGWRSALISLVAISLALVAAGFVLYLSHVPMNMMLLAGLVMALGVVVDDAIIVVENIARRLRQHRQAGSDKSAASIVLEASGEMHSAILFATLIILLAVLPILFMEGLSGLFFQPLAFSYALAVLTSLAVALMVTPVLSLTLLANAPLEERGESSLLRWLRRGYDSVLSRVVSTPRLAYLTAGVVGLAGFVALPVLGQSLLPSFKETDVRIEWESAPGTSRLEMNRTVARAASELRLIPGVRNVGSHVGRAITGDEVVGINSGELWVSLDPAADYDATLVAIREVIDGYPGVDHEVQSYQPERIGEALGEPDQHEPKQDMVVRIYGHDLKVLRDKAQEVTQVISGISDVVDARADLEDEEPQVEIEVDLAAAERHQVKPGDIRRQATTLLSGLQVGNLYEHQKVFDVMVWGAPELRSSLTKIRGLQIATPGAQVPLGELAEVRIVPSPIIIKRDAVSRFIDIGVDVRGRDLGAVAADIEGRLRQVKFPLEYHAEVLGGYAKRQAAQQRTLGLAVAVVIGIFLLLQAAFRSWGLASLVLLVLLPVALSGGVLAAFLGGGILSLGSLCGFLTLLGIGVRNVIAMASHFQHLERHEGETFGSQLVLRGARERFGPIVMTALATGLALVPFVIAGDVPGHEIARPMAVVILGGLVTSTLLTLFVVPSLYLRFGASREPELEGLGLPRPSLHRA